jgi:hypothetical protein
MLATAAIALPKKDSPGRTSGSPVAGLGFGALKPGDA